MADPNTAGAAPKKPYVLGPVPGGKLPELGTLINTTLAEFVDNLGPYLFLGLAQLLIVFPFVFVALFVIYAVVFGVGAIGAVGTSAIARGVGGDAGDVVASGGLGLTVVAMFVALLLVAGGLGAILAPFNASLVRAVAKHQRGELKVEFGSAFSTLSENIGGVIAAGLINAVGVSIGLLLCYFPALLWMAVAGMGTTMVVLHGVSAVAAFRRSIGHFFGNVAWYGVFALVYILIVMVASNVPLLGPMFAVALHVRAYRELFGDGPEPVFEVA